MSLLIRDLMARKMPCPIRVASPKRRRAIVLEREGTRRGLGLISMIQLALGLFALAAIAGAALATLHLRGRVPPWALTVLHGLLATSGLLTLIVEVSGYSTVGWLHGIVAMFVLAALGGILVVSFHIRKRRPPPPLILVHGTGAVTTFVLLLLYVMGVIPA